MIIDLTQSYSAPPIKYFSCQQIVCVSELTLHQLTLIWTDMFNMTHLVLIICTEFIWHLLIWFQENWGGISMHRILCSHVCDHFDFSVFMKQHQLFIWFVTVVEYFWPMIIYRMVIVEGHCTKLQLLISYIIHIIIGWQ